MEHSIFIEQKYVKGQKSSKKRKKFFKYCLECGKKFYPEGKFQKLCPECSFCKKNYWRLKIPTVDKNIKKRLLKWEQIKKSSL